MIPTKRDEAIISKQWATADCLTPTTVFFLSAVSILVCDVMMCSCPTLCIILIGMPLAGHPGRAAG